MQVADLIRLMLERLREETDDYSRLREELDRTKGEKELTQRRLALLNEARSKLEQQSALR